VSMKDDFFELGGHSLKATRLAALVHKEFQVKIELKDFFAETILEDQARLIEGSVRTSFATIEPVEPQKDYALSSSQRRLWILSQFEEANRAYNMPGVCVFEGSLDRKAFEAAYASLVERHESLRTTFRENEQGEVRQFIQLPGTSGFALDYFDLRSEAGRELMVKELIGKDLARSFDLSAGPLLRASLYQTEDSRWVFSYVMHHIISDGWSMNILTRELLQLYDAHARGVASSLTPLRIQYKDYAAWQQQQLGGERLQAHKDYWMKQFEGEIPVLELASDKPRPAVKTYNGEAVHLILNAELSKGLKELTRQQGGTLFMGILAAVNTLLYRYTGQEDIILGSPIAGRQHADLEEQIGFYLNTLALRSRFNGEQSFSELLEQAKQVTLDAYEHQAYPFDELVDLLALRRDLSRSALFDVMVVLQNNERSGGGALQDLGGLRISNYGDSEATGSKFDLSFTFSEKRDELQLVLAYNSDIYTASTAERMVRHLERLVSAIIREPQKPIQQLDYLQEEEKQQLLVQFNGTAVDYPRDKTITQLFEEQVRRTPEATALVFEERKLSYQELNEHANQLAHYLKHKYSIQPGELVAICLERSPALVISIVAVLKAGGAYVPIDPQYPQERIDYMLEDSRSKVLINPEELEQFSREQEQHSREDLSASGLQPSDLAYVIYTSGSSGKPKGVMVQHRALANLCFWHNSNFSVQAEDRTTLYAGVAFDASAWELFPYIICGATLYIVPEDIRLDIDKLAEYYEANRITIGFLPTQIGEQFIAAAEPSSLRFLLVGGDKLNSFTGRKYAIVNNYGPTENTVVAASGTVTHQTPNIPIGKPVSNTEVYILDDRLNLQGPGVPGEICIGGESLAQGYWNRPELTAEKFVANPFRTGERMYLTGDLGRWLEDGSIEFLGRKDEQVKVRGYRVELGEIGSVLQNHESIGSCVVVAKTNQQGEKELVAYVTGKQELNASELRTWLGRSLPNYMIPAHYVQLDALPLTANGKVDYKALPDPAGFGMGTSADYVAPRNETEEKLVALWQEVLGREKIGVKDNFFELGGHSLKLTKLANRIKKEFDVNLGMRTLFSNPTIEAIAGEIKKFTGRTRRLMKLMTLKDSPSKQVPGASR
ncbi:MAG TPA: amino acid adenylation domain-containing protein, partial [Flavisolibacter sp.]